MKELSIEEKAKRYDEALKVLHKYDGANIMFSLSLKEEMFPELKEESEDERIRKELIAFLKENHETGRADETWSISGLERWIDWLKSLKERVQPKQEKEWKQENIDDLTDFENVMMHIGDSFFGENAGLDPNDTTAIKEQANILSGLVPSKEWSEEDRIRIANCIQLIGKTGDGEVEWLKSLESRILPQTKQKWSEEDEKMRAAVLQLITDSEKENGWNCVYCNDKEIYFSDIIAWLKSIRPHSQWKPSVFHLECIEDAISLYKTRGINAIGLKEVLDELKKLREE